jgi:hypothetical protein
MSPDRKYARWAGIFFIIATAAPISTIFFVDFLGGGIAGQPVPGYLGFMAAHEARVIFGLLVELSWALAVAGIAVMLFSVLKQHDAAGALGFFALRSMEAMSVILYGIILLCLLTVSREYAAAPDASWLPGAGALLLAAREWTFLIGSGLVWALSALVLNSLLFRRRLVPRWLSAWGFIGAVLSLGNYLPQLFGVGPPALLFLPIAVQEMVFAVRLIARGLDSSAATAASSGP